MDNKASITSLMSAFVRAYHYEKSTQPIFADTYAKRLISSEEYERIKSYIISGADFFLGDDSKCENTDELLNKIVNTQLAPTPLARARYCEEALKTAVRTGTTQYVILGAGLDTFAWRESELIKKISVFEVDHPLTQQDKKQRIDKAGLEIPPELHFVPVDFTCDDLRVQLRSSGFDETKKTFFSCLGVSYYLPQDKLEKLICDISMFASEGSSFLFDFGNPDLMCAKEKRVINMREMASAANEPLRFACDDFSLAKMLEKHSFMIYDLLSPKDIQERYFDGRSDGMTAFEHISYALAVIKGSGYIRTKEKILKTALHLFSERGYDAVSVQDIADRLLITKGALYKHYANKRDIFDSVLARMEELDRKRAEEYHVPEESYIEDPEGYSNIKLKDIIEYAKAQFRYFTEDDFACAFRRMITVEQYHTDEMAKLYKQYFSEGPLEYVTHILNEITHDSNAAKIKSIQICSSMCMFYAIYDVADIKSKVTEEFEKYIDSLYEV